MLQDLLFRSKMPRQVHTIWVFKWWFWGLCWWIWWRNHRYENWFVSKDVPVAFVVAVIRPLTAATPAVTPTILFTEMFGYVMWRLYSSYVLSTKVGRHRIELINKNLVNDDFSDFFWIFFLLMLLCMNSNIVNNLLSIYFDKQNKSFQYGPVIKLSLQILPSIHGQPYGIDQSATVVADWSIGYPTILTH